MGKLMQSLQSRGYVSLVFSWQWFYWKLTDEGVEYLQNYMHLPAHVKPDTHQQDKRAGTAYRGGSRGGRGGFRGREDRRDDGYRGPKEEGSSSFSGRGRGRGRGRGAFGRGGFASRAAPT